MRQYSSHHTHTHSITCNTETPLSKAKTLHSGTVPNKAYHGGAHSKVANTVVCVDALHRRMDPQRDHLAHAFEEQRNGDVPRLVEATAEMDDRKRDEHEDPRDSLQLLDGNVVVAVVVDRCASGDQGDPAEQADHHATGFEESGVPDAEEVDHDDARDRRHHGSDVVDDFQDDLAGFEQDRF